MFAVLVWIVKSPAGAKEDGFLISVTLIEIDVSAAISELGNVIERVNEVKEQDNADEEGDVIEHAELREGIASEGNVIISMDEASTGEG